MATPTNKIYSLIPKIMAGVGAIGKNGVNDFDKYKFRSIDDVYNKLQPVLAFHGVFFVPSVLESTENKFESKNGTPQVRVKLRVQYKIFADDGSSIDALVESEAVDRSDKATNKALTAAFKYLLIQIFCIAVEGQDDADKESLGLSVVQEKKPITQKKGEAPAAKDLKIGDGKYRGQMLSKIPPEEIKAYIAEIEAATKAAGKKYFPKWFSELKAATNL